MKPAPFEYKAPETLDEAISDLAECGDEGKILAGGQSLVPSMNFRLARPAILIDLNRVPGLDRLETSAGKLEIGALVRHVRLESPVNDDPLSGLLNSSARLVGHLPIRVRGTFGGSLAHADPAAEWCLLATVLDAEIVATSVRGQRVIPASEFFRTVFTTALEPDEILSSVRLPLLGKSARAGFVEFSRRAGDFAIVAAMAVLQLEGSRVSAARIGIGGVEGTPLRATTAEGLLVGEEPDRSLIAEAAACAAENSSPMEDIHGSVEYRKDLVRVLVRRAIEAAISGES